MGGFEGKGERGSRRVGGARGIESGSLWLAPNLSKRWGEIFFLLYTPFWLTLCLGIIVPYKLYEGLIMSWEATEFVISIFGDGEERVIGTASAVPTEIGAKRVVEVGVGDFSIGVEAKLVGFDCGGVDPDAADVGTNLEDEDAGAPSWQRGKRSGNR